MSSNLSILACLAGQIEKKIEQAKFDEETRKEKKKKEKAINSKNSERWKQACFLKTETETEDEAQRNQQRHETR